MIKLSIIIPAYNEEKRITETLNDYYKYFYEKLGNKFELIIIPNNCSDKTLEVVKKFAKGKKQIKYKNIDYYSGKGGAIIEGFKIAKGELIGFTDADSSTSAEAYYELYKNIEGYEGIIASRWIKGAKVNPKQPLLRRIASRTFNTIVRVLFNIKIKDTQCGAKLFKKKQLLETIPLLTTPRWAFDVDLLYQFKRKGYKIKEIPTTWSDNGGSKLNVKKASIEMLLAITRLRMYYSPLKIMVKLANKLDWKVNKK